MGIRNLSEDVILVTLTEDSKINKQLKAANEAVYDSGDVDVIVAFGRVEMVTSYDLSNLLILRDTVMKNGRRLIFCNVGFPTKCIFTVSGLEEIFEIVDDKFAALAELQKVKN